MTGRDGDPPGARWAVLLALPVLCCVGHAVLVATAARQPPAGEVWLRLLEAARGL